VAESYTGWHHRICAYGRQTQVSKARFGAKKGYSQSWRAIIIRCPGTHQIVLAGSSPERFWPARAHF
jgi:hypothetical protein